MAADSIPSISDFPADMIAAAVLEAERRADWAADYLHALGEDAMPKNRLTVRFLLHLGAALRLWKWEADGFHFHREAGLPDADQAMREAIAPPNAATPDPTELCLALLRLTLERFAWTGPRELGIDVAVKDGNEDVLLEALADFLWAHRPR